AVASNNTTLIWSWFHAGGIFTDPRFLFLFRDVSKMIAFPLIAIFTAIYYLRVERTGRVVERARDEGEQLDPDEVDSDIAEELAEEKESRPVERHSAAPEPDRDSGRLESTGRLGAPKRLGDDDDDQ
ncbi:MAG: hypothetical protein ACTSWA_13365, partial [Candidatus Thorarchaeota archaeon]